MAPTNNLTTQPNRVAPLGKRMLMGAGIGLILISLFLLSAGVPRPEWGDYWRIRPLIIETVAGAGGGLFYWLLNDRLQTTGWKKVLMVFIGLFGMLVALWLGSVLGLVGTYWH